VTHFMRTLCIQLSLLACVLGYMSNAQALEVDRLHAKQANDGYEASLIGVIDQIEARSLASALILIDAHLLSFPKSREGHFIRADILQAMSGSLSGVGSHKLVNGESLTKFKHQLQNRLKHIGEAANIAHTHFPSNLISLGKHKHIMVADMSDGRLYLYKNNSGQPELLRDYYLTIGSAGFGKEVEGDNRTPVGVYEVNRYIEGKALPDLYGKGAFPVNYPNRYDRSLKRTGYGIWLHGTPSSTYARSPWASEGCFVLSNDDLLDIGQYISAKDRTPVVLSDTIEWVSGDELAQKQRDYLSVLAQWKADWESLDVQAYLQHYSAENFNLGRDDFNAWSKRKRVIGANKTFIQLDLTLQSLFVYPGEEDMFVVKYRQRYLSNNYSGSADKEQYWQKDKSGQWKIIYEG